MGAKIKEETDTVIYMYADDMALVSETIPDLEKAVALLSIWAQTNEIKINKQKTELVVFRKGGKVTESERIKCNGKPLQRVNHFKYLGLMIQTTGKSFRIHLRSRMVAAVRAMNDIKDIKLISLGTAMQLFRLKVVPTLTYGMELIWESHVQATPRIRKNEGQILEKSARGVSTQLVKIGVRAGKRNLLRQGPKNLPNPANNNSLQRRTLRNEQ
jgi:hypothetical protein